METLLSKEAAFKLVNTDKVYNSFDLEELFIEEEQRYPTMREILKSLGVEI